MSTSVKRSIFKKVRRIYAHKITDIYILSYPKSGRTWLRMLIGSLLNHQFNLNLNDKDKGSTLVLTKKLSQVPTIQFVHDDNPGNVPYSQLKADKSHYQKKQLVLMIRDPRDVVVSAFYQYKYRKKRPDVQNLSLSEFLKHDTGALKSIVRYYNIWAEAHKKHEKFHFVSYEGLLTDGDAELQRLMNFLGISVKPENIVKAIEENSFARLKQKEQTGTLNDGFFTKKADENESKVRSGKIGGYKEKLSEEDILWMNQYIAENLSREFSQYH